jgi:hypothetical protein
MLTNHHAGTIDIVINERKARGDIAFTCIRPRFVEGHIIPFECSFQTLSGENRRSPQLMETT